MSEAIVVRPGRRKGQKPLAPEVRQRIMERLKLWSAHRPKAIAADEGISDSGVRKIFARMRRISSIREFDSDGKEA